MIVVTIEISLDGVEPLRWIIGSMQISDVSDHGDVRDYRVKATEAPNALAVRPRREAECTILGQPRGQSMWALVREAAAELDRSAWRTL